MDKVFKKMNDSERLELFLRHVRKTKNAIGKSIGDKNGMRLTHVETGRNKISEKLASDIVQVYKDVSYDWLLKGEGEMLVNNISFKPTAIYIDNSTSMDVPLVNQYAWGSYLNGFGDSDYLENLPKIPWESDKEHKGEYLCFEVKGDSMDNGTSEALLEGDILLCRSVRQDYWRSKLHIHKWDFVIVHREKGIVVKRITRHDVENGIITLHSLNDYYDDYDVHLSDVAQIFNIVDFKRRPRSRR